MVKQLFTVGQLSKLFNVKISTLRYYDKMGILKPAKVNVESHYRYYSTEQFERLNTINYLRSLGMPIGSIRKFFDARDTELLRQMLLDQRSQVEGQIASLQSVKQRINDRIDQVNDAIESNLDVIELVNLPAIPIILLDEIYRAKDDIEFPITTLIQQFGVNKNIFLGKIALTLSKSQLIQKKFENYSGLLLVLEPGDNESATGQLVAGKYVRIRFNGTHENSVVQYQKLIEYCQKHNYQIAGDAVETALIDYGLTDDLSKYVTEIKIPVIE